MLEHSMLTSEPSLSAKKKGVVLITLSGNLVDWQLLQLWPRKLGMFRSCIPMMPWMSQKDHQEDWKIKRERLHSQKCPTLKATIWNDLGWRQWQHSAEFYPKKKRFRFDGFSRPQKNQRLSRAMLDFFRLLIFLILNSIRLKAWTMCYFSWSWLMIILDPYGR